VNAPGSPSPEQNPTSSVISKIDLSAPSRSASSSPRSSLSSPTCAVDDGQTNWREGPLNSALAREVTARSRTRGSPSCGHNHPTKPLRQPHPIRRVLNAPRTHLPHLQPSGGTASQMNHLAGQMPPEMQPPASPLDLEVIIASVFVLVEGRQRRDSNPRCLSVRSLSRSSTH
jgi:hypothetical protein